jgi:acylpyruvate hydrolase
MRLVTFAHHGGTHIGALVARDDHTDIFDFNRAQPDLPTDMTEFLKSGQPAWALAHSALTAAGERYFVPAAEVTLLAPVPRPGKIVCLGRNYRDHTDAAGASSPPPEHPTFFAKFSNVVIGPNQPIVYPRISIQMDYEAELMVVIGRRTRYTDEAHALECVAGYTIFNDMTARDYQNLTSQWTLGKSFDTFGPMGPALVTADEIPEPGNLDLSLSLNGQEMQRSNTRNLIFSIPFIIAYLSQAMTLEPGDVIATGTPSGIGSMRRPPVFMKPGDEVRIVVEKLGELINRVVAEGNRT